MHMILLMIGILAGVMLQAQVNLIPSFNISQPANQVYTDNLENILLVKNDQIIKYNSTGQLYRIYSNKLLGRISSIDPMNPLKMPVFYSDFYRILFLDNTLTENGEALRLEDRKLETASLIAASYDNGLWVYDPIQFSLIRFDQRLQESAIIQNLQQILGFAPNADCLSESGNFLFMGAMEKGILVFDFFGTYLYKIPANYSGKFQVLGNFLYFKTPEGELKRVDLKSRAIEDFAKPDSAYFDFRIGKNRVYLLNEKGLQVMELK